MLNHKDYFLIKTELASGEVQVSSYLYISLNKIIKPVYKNDLEINEIKNFRSFLVRTISQHTNGPTLAKNLICVQPVLTLHADGT